VTFLLDNEDSLWGALNEANLALWAEGGGPLTSNTAEVGGFLRTRPELPIPDVQLHMISVMFEEEALAPPPAHGFSINACVLRPRARGAVTVISPDPLTKPYIVHNYLRDEEDTRSLVAGVRTMLELAGTAPLADHVSGPHLAPAGDSDAEIEAFVRRTMQGLYHPVGTCAMGTGPDAVVDAACRVHGVEGLRVVDASVFPSVPRGNTNAPTIALAERASDLIRGRTPLREEPAVAVV
jgi:choline dehydrogenase-like flavoprotein